MRYRKMRKNEPLFCKKNRICVHFCERIGDFLQKNLIFF